MGADLHYWDPRVERWDVGGRDIPRVDELAGPGDADFDLVVLLQHHNEIDPVILAAWGDQVFDTRGVLETGHSL